jgi:tight adherence protein B
MELLIVLGVFISIVGLSIGAYMVYSAIRNPDRLRVQSELRALSSDDSFIPQTPINLEKKRILSDLPWLNQLLNKVPKLSNIEDLWRQSNSKYPLSMYLLSSLLIFFAAAVIFYFVFSGNFFLILIPSLILAFIPFFILYRMKNKRLAKFESQLADAMDLIARSMKAGHAFSTGMKMVATELGDPIGTEFGRTIDEISFGMDMEQALTNLLKRVNCADLKFFVMALILHREAGGNLAEILTNISRLIRERFKFFRKVKTLSAQGRMSAAILLSLPFFLAAVLSMTAPGYMNIFFTDRVAQLMGITGLIFLGIGFMVIRRIIDIKV